MPLIGPKTPVPIEQVAAVDSETCLIRSGLPCPPVVCTSFAWRDKPAKLFSTQDQWQPLLEHLANPNTILVGHNIAYDMGCYLEWGPDEIVPLIVKAYDEDRVLDTMLAQRLTEIETGIRGGLALDRVAAQYGLEVSKEVTAPDGRPVRTTYGQYLGRPTSEYSNPHRSYAVKDAEITLELFCRVLRRGLVGREDLARLGRAALALASVAGFGLMADPARVESLEEMAKERLETFQDEMIQQGFMRWERNKEKPVRTGINIKRAVAEAYGIEMGEHKHNKGQAIGYGEHDLRSLAQRGLITKSGQISTSADTLKNAGDPLLEAMCEYGEWSAVWNKDLKVFRWSAQNELPFHTRFGFANTLRTTSGGGSSFIPGMNIQNYRRKEGIRECIKFRHGAGVATDYTGLENTTLAQTIIWTTGRRGMADKISAGHDFHSEVGALIAGWQFDITNIKECMAKAAEFRALVDAEDPEAGACRQAAKPLNFGLPGGMMNPATVASYARLGYRVNRPIEFWGSMIDLWYGTQHDQVTYLQDYVPSLRNGDVFNAPLPGSGVVRRGCTMPAAANSGFQPPGAFVATDALWRVFCAQLLGEMPGRLCAFIHDELISDCRPDQVEDVRRGHEKHMLAAAEAFLPDVKSRAESTAMTNWSKKAKKILGPDGELLVDHIK